MHGPNLTSQLASAALFLKWQNYSINENGANYLLYGNADYSDSVEHPCASCRSCDHFPRQFFPIVRPGYTFPQMISRTIYMKIDIFKGNPYNSTLLLLQHLKMVHRPKSIPYFSTKHLIRGLSGIDTFQKINYFCNIYFCKIPKLSTHCITVIGIKEYSVFSWGGGVLICLVLF